jgi:hypothetical protein
MKLQILFSAVLAFSSAYSQTVPKTYSLDTASQQGRPSDNAIYEILAAKGNVYITSYKGLNVTTDGGKTFQPEGPAGVSTGPITMKSDTIVIAAYAPNMNVNGSSLPAGAGLYFSTDNGTTWTHEPQSEDSLSDSTVIFGKDTLKALPWPTIGENLSYSLCFYQGYLYTANFAAGLRRSSDLGRTWQRVVLPPDYLNYITQDSTYHFQLSVQTSTITTEANLNQEVFSVYSDGDSALYVGTAGGIDKTTDNCYSWRKFSHQNESSPISGNFVVSLAGQDLGATHYIWGATKNATDPAEVEALSYSSDGGASWHYILSGHFFHSIAFQDSTVYGASDDGLFRTRDFGVTSQIITNVYDPVSKQSIFSQAFSAVATNGDSVWLGSTDDGTAMGIDNGNGFDPSTWRVFRAFVSVANTNSTYFYPNPFSPNLDIGRIHYYVKNPGSQVTIRIFDFSMHIVRTLLQNAPRDAGERDDRWNGASDRGGLVDNGVYFYSVVVGGGTPSWGKIMVIR